MKRASGARADHNLTDTGQLGYIKTGTFTPPQPKPGKRRMGRYSAAGIQDIYVDPGGKITKGPMVAAEKVTGW